MDLANDGRQPENATASITYNIHLPSAGNSSNSSSSSRRPRSGFGWSDILLYASELICFCCKRASHGDCLPYFTSCSVDGWVIYHAQLGWRINKNKGVIISVPKTSREREYNHCSKEGRRPDSQRRPLSRLSRCMTVTITAALRQRPPRSVTPFW